MPAASLHVLLPPATRPLPGEQSLVRVTTPLSRVTLATAPPPRTSAMARLTWETPPHDVTSLLLLTSVTTVV